MSVALTKKSEGFFVVNIKGILAFDEQKEIEGKAQKDFGDTQNIKILVLATQFDGWGKKGDWGDLTFMREHDPQIAKIAVVTEEQWHDWMAMFISPYKRQAEVKIFSKDEEDEARSWLQI
jgi:hypothetical protein